MSKYKLLYICFILLLVFTTSFVSADENSSIILQNDRTDDMMGEVLTMLSLAAVIFAIAVIIKIILMLQGSE